MRQLMLALVLVLVTASVAAEGFYFELGGGVNTSLFGGKEWDNGGGAGAYFSFRYEQDNYVIHYTHYSQWDVGPPVNNRSESTLDHIGIAFRWRIR